MQKIDIGLVATGKVGSGKTTVLRLIADELKKHGLEVQGYPGMEHTVRVIGKLGKSEQ